MLKYLERKRAMGGSRITAGDYSEAGLMHPISKPRWVQFWARAGAGKRGGESGLHATLIKAVDHADMTRWEGQDDSKD